MADVFGVVGGAGGCLSQLIACVSNLCSLHSLPCVELRRAYDSANHCDNYYVNQAWWPLCLLHMHVQLHVELPLASYLHLLITSQCFGTCFYTVFVYYCCNNTPLTRYMWTTQLARAVGCCGWWLPAAA